MTATLAYASPEQLTGSVIDGRSDQYALACTLFQLLTGVVPFEGTSPAAVIRGHLQLPPPPASPLRTELPRTIDPVLARALSKRPQDRYRSCAEFAAAVEQALRPVVPPRPPTPAHPQPIVVAPRQPTPARPQPVIPTPATPRPQVGPLSGPAYQNPVSGPAYQNPVQNSGPAYQNQAPAYQNPAPVYQNPSSGPAYANQSTNYSSGPVQQPTYSAPESSSFPVGWMIAGVTAILLIVIVVVVTILYYR